MSSKITNLKNVTKNYIIAINNNFKHRLKCKYIIYLPPQHK